ncbi:DNA repair protein rad16 [Exophiala xenobiotica]|nr:DNA repair protein rad16 [Exophiala xenobiotica]
MHSYSIYEEPKQCGRANRIQVQCVDADYFVKSISQPGHSDLVPFQLMSHQREGVGFSIRPYKKRYGGCCCADDPGLGKTLQTSGLMMEADKDCRSAHLVDVRAGLLDKWKEDLRDYLNTNHPKFPHILIYYGDGRKGKWEENLKAFDIIVTTYNIVKSEQRDYEAHRRQK